MLNIFEEPEDYLNSCVDVPKVYIKLSTEQKLINELSKDPRIALFKIKTITGTKGYVYERIKWYDGNKCTYVNDWFIPDILCKEDDMLYVSGYKNEPLVITDKSSNLLFMINDNYNDFKNINYKYYHCHISIPHIDMYNTKLVYIDTITVKQKVALMLSLMNYKNLPYEPELFKKICNYVS